MELAHWYWVDPDHIEEKNLNRILGATIQDAQYRTLKVDVARRNIDRMGLGTEVVTFQTVCLMLKWSERSLIAMLSLAVWIASTAGGY
jgi:tRNA A37 threonylcarbamoyladenosine dehydratase